MAENKKNDAVEKENVTSPTVNENDYVDEYSLNAFEDASIAGVFHTSEKLFVTKYPIQSAEVVDEKGTKHMNYAIAYLVSINGGQKRQKFRVRPKGGSSVLIEDMKTIMSTPGPHPLEIVKRTMRDSKSGAITSTYSLQASCVTDDGVRFVCPLEPVFTPDKASWENFKRIRIARGDID